MSARIATGGMAEVYLARAISLDGQRGPSVAVKRLMPHLVADRRIVQMFLNEARITAQVRHPNVVSILELGMEGGEPFIAMELLEGRSFAEVRQEAAERGQRVPLGITLRVLVDACRGLDAAHRAVDEAGRPLHIVHRDFTPDNIHVGANGAVKVIDFGIAKADALGSGTEPGTLKGKFFYMSPEMIAGRSVDHRADLFAAGVMLYEQLCGRRPFTGMSTEEVLTRISEGKPKPPTAFDPSVPQALETVCLKALAKDPEARFDGLQTFIAAIELLGGPAEVAAPAQVAAYLDTLFPPDRDPKRLALRNARLADPSNSGADGAPGMDVLPPFGVQGIPSWPVPPPVAAPTASRPLPPLGTHTVSIRGATRPVTAELPVSTSGHTAEGAAHGVGASASGSKGRAPAGAHTPASRGAPRSRRIIAIVAGVLALGGLGAGATWYLRRPDLPPPARIAAAEAATTAEAKVSALDGLGKDVRATAKELARAGTLLLDAGAHPQALALAEEYTSRFPKEAEAHLLAARAATELRMGKRAERAIDEATALAPKDVRAPLALADLRALQGDVPGALTALAKAYAQAPGSARVAPRYGQLLSQGGRLDEAAAVLSAWTRQHDDAESLAELGFVRFRQEKLDDAVALLKRAQRKAPTLAVAHSYLGAVLFRQGDLRGAEREYLEAERLAPNDPRALTARCQLHAHEGDTARVAEVKRTLEERFPDRAQALAAECGTGN
ncbi:putative serine/threonine protein kinase [Corallococcus coralloides]|uniref:Putative serine/threonine protein kinase n=2 Tax=Corallococcus coralloides TaxID=184914 RepID=A0A410S1S8_CORCK|nr:serine/threonine-protein kinase [Corallococcus coralloides]QAT88104.1 putative serine/threonine protein kinase [Corallococcus coralloides]